MSQVLLLQGTATHIPLKDATAQCVMTSPSYYGLRSYGIGEGELGQEETPGEYVAAMVQVFREVRRVLRPEGTLWLNMGDSYSGSGRGPTGHNGIGDQTTRQGFHSPKMTDLAIPAKNLLGLPWRLAFALQADGWILRSDIIWQKPSCMPESVQDRPTRDHEYVFLFSKQSRYYYNADAIKEDSVYPGDTRHLRTDTRRLIDPYCCDDGARQRTGHPTGTTRNARSVWRIPSEPFSGLFFAAFPPTLVRRCLMAGCPPGGIVFDPFCGSGTTLLVARELGHHAIGMDLSAPTLHGIARERLGLAALARWEGRTAPASTLDLGDLPLFAGLR